MNSLTFTQIGFCPFRIQKLEFRAGCVLKLGKEVLCYTQDLHPLLVNNGRFFCPELQFKLSTETYKEIETFVKSILTIQDEENTATNLWTIITGMSDPKNKATTIPGKKLVKISKKVREELDEIVLNLT